MAASDRKGPRIVSRAERAAEAARTYAPLGLFFAAAAGSGYLGARFNPGPNNPDIQRWYAALPKSPLNPPPVVFAPVWTMLYALMSVAAWRVYRAPRSRARSQALALWAAQMALNAAWSPIFFGQQNPTLAMVDLIALAGAIVAFSAKARKVDRTAAALMLPYLAWVTFAGYLNEEVVRRSSY